MPLVKVGSIDVQVSGSMKYLGVIIDSSWSFRDHFAYVEGKVVKVTRALSRLMLNLRGPGKRKRQLYATVLTSVAMYVAPVWGGTLSNSSDRILRPWRRLQCTFAIRVIAAYRSVSFDAATLIARMPPWTLEASMRSRIYARISENKNSGTYDHKVDAEIRSGEALLLTRQWDIFLGRPDIWGQKTVSAIRPYLRKWIDRKFGETNYYSTQMLTGYGSLNHFLWRWGKERIRFVSIVPIQTIR